MRLGRDHGDEYLMKSRHFCARVIAFSLALCLLPAAAQNVSEPGYANMQRAVGGIVSDVAITRGASTTDPRTYATLYGMGKAAATGTAAGGVATGLLVAAGAVSAPAWGTLLAMAAVTGAVSYAVGIVLDKSIRWLFSGADVSVAKVITNGPSNCASAKGGADCVCPNQSMARTLTLTQAAPAQGGTAYYALTCTCATDNQGACTSGGGATSAPVTMQTAKSQMTPAQLQQPLAHESMALIVNDLWKRAAAQPDYTGLPYQVTSPVLASDVERWQQANPAAYPTAAALLTPVTDGGTGFAPSASTSASSSTTPATSGSNPYATPTTTPTTNPTTPGSGNVSVVNKPTVILEVPDALPAAGLPGIEATPSARTIFQPFLTLIQPLLNVQIPLGGECPRPSFDAFEKTITMDSFCDLAEQQREPIAYVMTAVFLVTALLIIFSA